jgi:hypothetical protein
MAGSIPYALPASEGLVVGSAVSSESTISKYKGGSLLGWNLYGKTKSKIVLYDNSEKAEGRNYGPLTLNEHESIRDWFGSNGIQFKEAIWMKVVEGEVEGVLFLDIE